MSVELEVYLLTEGREQRASIQRLADSPAGHRYRVALGDRHYEVDAARAGDAWSLIIEGRQHEITVVNESPKSRRGGSGASAPACWVSAEGVTQRIELLEPLAYLTAQRGAASGRSRTGTVVAEMPGRVVSCLVAEGDRVAMGKGVLVVEAMKMENEILAEAEGVVTKIYVESGSAVESGDPLFDLSPAEAE